MNHSGKPITNLKELFYKHFAYTVDDLADADETANSTAADYTALINNNLTDAVSFTLNQFVEINLGSVCYIKRMRYHGITTSNPGSRYRLQAYVDGVWEDCLVDIVDIDATEWDVWLDLTTPRTSILWRLECTTFVGAAKMQELELHGVAIG